jgi:phosphatidylglycerophosphate synthase
MGIEPAAAFFAQYPVEDRMATHVRHHHSLLAAAEKRLLIHLARRLPEWVGSDHLSALGLVAMASAGLSFALFSATIWAGPAVVCSLVVNWFGDSLDGTLARVRGHERPRYGYYLDHVIDLAGTSLLLAGLGCSGLMHPLFAAGVLAAYLLVCAESYLAAHSLAIFRMSFLGWGPTELRLLLAAGALQAMRSPDVVVPAVGRVLLFDVGAALAGIGLIVAFATAAVRNTRALYAEEPLPGAGSAATVMPRASSA